MEQSRKVGTGSFQQVWVKRLAGALFNATLERAETPRHGPHKGKEYLLPQPPAAISVTSLREQCMPLPTSPRRPLEQMVFGLLTSLFPEPADSLVHENHLPNVS